LNPDNFAVLEKMGKLIYLDISKEVIKKRIFSAPTPSYLDPNNLDASFEKMYQARKALYDTFNAHKIVLDGKTDDQILDEILGFFGHGHAHAHGHVFLAR
jgi:shikimate kinase